MSTTLENREVQSLRREVAGLRRDLQRLKSDLLWQESRRRFNREITLQVVIIIASFAFMGAMLALVGVASRR